MPPDSLKELVQSLLSALGAHVESLQVSDGPRTVVAVQSPDGKELIGPRGEALQAINTLARRLAETRAQGEASAFLIDINGYHEARLRELRENARL